MVTIANCFTLMYCFCPQELPLISKTIFINIVLFFRLSTHCFFRHSSIFCRQRIMLSRQKNPDRICGWLYNIHLNYRTCVNHPPNENVIYVYNICWDTTDSCQYLDKYIYVIPNSDTNSYLLVHVCYNVYFILFRHGHIMVTIPWIVIHKHWSSLVRDTCYDWKEVGLNLLFYKFANS